MADEAGMCWKWRGADVIDSSDVGRVSRLICRVNTDLPDWEAYAELIARVPRFVEAIRAAEAALEAAAPYLELDSDADYAALRAFREIHDLLLETLRVPMALAAAQSA